MSASPPAKDANKRLRRATITYFGIEPPKTDMPKYVTYLCYQQETCPTTGKLHWQTYAEFDHQVTTKMLQKWMPRCHVVASEGSAKQNFEYCSKSTTSVPGTFYEFGEAKQQGSRTDLLGVMKSIIVDKMTIDQLKDCPETMATYAKYPRGIQAVAELHDTEEVIDRHVEWHWGVSGSGKSTYVRSLHPKDDIYEAAGFEWFNGYAGQKCIFFDDVDDVRFDRQLLLKITDKASVRLWVKNGSKICRATHIYFTSNRAPSGQWLPEQLFRRIDLIGHWPTVHPECKISAIKETFPKPNHALQKTSISQVRIEIEERSPPFTRQESGYYEASSGSPTVSRTSELSS